jgi:hypothetical protein
MLVHRDTGCGCCEGWVAALRVAGYPVDVSDVDHVERLTRFGIPESLASCHTGLIRGYLVEGHVPLGGIAKLLRENPRTRGIALPGMPTGAPGMSGPKVPLRVVLLDRASTTFYAE